MVMNESLDNNYISFTSNQSSLNSLNIGSGLYLYSKNIFFGIAADQLTRDLFVFGIGSSNFDNRTHVNLTEGVKLPINFNFTITPAFLFKYMSLIIPVVEGSIQLEYKEWLCFTTFYRYKDAIIPMFG